MPLRGIGRGCSSVLAVCSVLLRPVSWFTKDVSGIVPQVNLGSAFQVSICRKSSFAVPWRIPCFLLYLYARQHLVLRYSRMPLELTQGSKSEHLAVSHQARQNRTCDFRRNFYGARAIQGPQLAYELSELIPDF